MVVNRAYNTKLRRLATLGLSAIAGGVSVYLAVNTFDLQKYAYSPIVSIPPVTPTDKWDFNWDKRDPTSLVKPPKNADDPSEQTAYNKKLEKYKSKAARHIILIRHGQYNLEGKTDKQRVLTELGERQAALTGARLKELAFPYSLVIRSTMTRANQTAGFILKSLSPDINVKDCSMVEEGAPIEPEPPIRSWKPELHFFRDEARIEAAFRKYIHRAPPEQQEDSYEVIVCHGNVIRYFLCRALQLPPRAWLRFSINHGSMTWITVNPSGRVYLSSFSDVGYMPPDAVSH